MQLQFQWQSLVTYLSENEIQGRENDYLPRDKYHIKLCISKQWTYKIAPKWNRASNLFESKAGMMIKFPAPLPPPPISGAVK